MHKIMEYVCKEMEDLEKKIEKNGGLNPTDMQYLDTLAHTKKNLLKAEEMSEGSYRGSYRGSYDDGRMSYADPMYADDERTERSRYSTRRDRMGRYSREDGYSRDEGMIEELRNMMGDLPANKQRELQQLIKRYEA
jgi:hypothetical protein